MRYGIPNFEGWNGLSCFDNWNGSTHWINWIGGGIALFIGLILIAIVIYLLVSWTRNGRSQSVPPGFTSSTGDALKILDERYARGEISDEEYQRMKNRLLS